MGPTLYALAALAAAAGAAYHAASATIIEVADQQSEEDSAARLVEDYGNHFYAGDFDEALAAATQLQAIADNDDRKAIAGAMRASALLGLKRDEEARKLIADADRLAPLNPLPSTILFNSALVADKFDVAADALDRLIARFPDVVRELDSDFLYYFLRNEPEGQKTRNDDRRVALARLGYGGTLKGDDLTAGAIRILVDRGDTDGAIDLLRYVDEPRVIEDMLIQKRFAALWPRIEEMAGPRLEKVRASAFAVAERAYQQKPDDSERLQLLAKALRHAGRHDQAIALRSELPATPQAMALADEDTGWALNNIALALHEVGRADEADQLFESLNLAPMEQGRDWWRVSMIINRLELLVGDGKFDKALPLLAETETSATNDGNAYAQQLVRRLKFCTLSGLGRKEEAVRLLRDMLAHAKDAWHATVDGLLCAGDPDKAEQVILEALKSENSESFEEALVRSLQPKPLTSDDPSIWQNRWFELRQRPAIAREFDRLGRDMPEAFVPPDPKRGTTAASEQA